MVRAYQGGRDPVKPLTAEARIIDDHDRVVFSESYRLFTDPGSATRSADVRVDLPLRTMAPGKYLYIVTAALGRNSVAREVRFDIVH
jgi:hypothetical protein